jgi:hypothetical protein
MIQYHKKMEVERLCKVPVSLDETRRTGLPHGDRCRRSEPEVPTLSDQTTAQTPSPWVADASQQAFMIVSFPDYRQVKSSF